MRFVNFTIAFLTEIMFVGASKTLCTAADAANRRDTLQQNHLHSLNKHTQPWTA
jgi:hypothetical protein